MHKLKRDFYNRPTITVAKDLLGKYLIRSTNGTRKIGRIVEVEAYLGPHDRAAHSARGRTPRNEVMFGPPGHAYVYMIYGMHYCMNVVTEEAGHASAVLVRALEPVQNLAGNAHGPALLCRAMGIDKQLNGFDLESAEFFIASDGEKKEIEIVSRPRIGVDYAGIWARRLLRFYVKDSPFVSRK